jgi:hypothetical protein
MQNSDRGRLNVVAEAAAGCRREVGDDDEFRRSNPDDTEAGDPGDDPDMIRCPGGDRLLGGEQGGDAEFGRIVLKTDQGVTFEQ